MTEQFDTEKERSYMTDEAGAPAPDESTTTPGDAESEGGSEGTSSEGTGSESGSESGGSESTGGSSGSE